MTKLTDKIQFYWDDVPEQDLDQSAYQQCIDRVVSLEEGQLESISIIFCSDEALLSLNKKHLDHDYYTDILTFGYKYDPIVAELYISIDRVEENAEQNNVSRREELSRVIIHGCLHLLGYDDHSDEDKQKMRDKENEYLALLNF